ncbi:hypothetical protein VaNZ11_002721, partial [Volvox africanus]
WLPGDQRGRIDEALGRPPTARPSAVLAAGAAGAAAQPSKQIASAADAAADAATATARATATATATATMAVAAPEKLVCSWQASRAVCVVGQREYEVWAASHTGKGR